MSLLRVEELERRLVDYRDRTRNLESQVASLSQMVDKLASSVGGAQAPVGDRFYWATSTAAIASGATGGITSDAFGPETAANTWTPDCPDDTRCWIWKHGESIDIVVFDCETEE